MDDGRSVLGAFHDQHILTILALVIDPLDSNHWLYGTGATIYGGRDLLKVSLAFSHSMATNLTANKWDTAHNVTLKSLADGIEGTFSVLYIVTIN